MIEKYIFLISFILSILVFLLNKIILISNMKLGYSDGPLKYSMIIFINITLALVCFKYILENYSIYAENNELLMNFGFVLTFLLGVTSVILLCVYYSRQIKRKLGSTVVTVLFVIIYSVIFILYPIMRFVILVSNAL